MTQVLNIQAQTDAILLARKNSKNANYNFYSCIVWDKLNKTYSVFSGLNNNIPENNVILGSYERGKYVF